MKLFIMMIFLVNLLAIGNYTKEFEVIVVNFSSQDEAEEACWDELDEQVDDWIKEMVDEGNEIGGSTEYTAELSQRNDGNWDCTCKKDVEYSTND